jgi:hypothetical protein
MPAQRAPVVPAIELSLVINAQPRRVLKAFFDPESLGEWWQVIRSVTTPRVLGPYAVEWAAADFRDDIVGRLGGVFRGTVVQFESSTGFFVADAYWLPPDGEPIGPMALDVRCVPIKIWGGDEGDPDEVATRISIRQTGFEESIRWRRYYEIATVGWERALASLKQLVEAAR